MANRQKNLTKEEREKVNSYLLIFQMYCERNTIRRISI